jgi:hypothetical protein
MRPLALRFHLPSIFIENAAIHVLNPSIFARGPELVEVSDGKLPVLTQIDVDYSVTITNLYDQCHRSILSAHIITAKYVSATARQGPIQNEAVPAIHNNPQALGG